MPMATDLADAKICLARVVTLVCFWNVVMDVNNDPCDMVALGE